MLQKTSARYPRYGAYVSRPIKTHPIFRTAGLDFVPHRADQDSPAARTIPALGHLALWRFRADWHSVSRDEANSWLSGSERKRARHYPNSALAKRHLVGRAMLRCILSRMLRCRPDAIMLTDGTDGQPHLRCPDLRRTVCIHVAYAGVWIVIGLSATDLGIDAVMPVPSGPAMEKSVSKQLRTKTTTTPPDHLFPDVIDAPQQARCVSLSRLASIGGLGPEPVVATEYDAAQVIHTSIGQRYHILDLPMPGKITAAVALPQIVTRVDAFGWLKD
ncbi:4'-phosphopantetheinyl transferase family protein [Paraburkholderia tropica]|uniref:4'-phosphopantetheinyl transferase family protein n=1 Tax=Paraburkholderia tropica TaxID=92647 RepID=UPI002AB624DB|nr:hypothetical protein [Paraburkholderia tropica]